MSIMRRDYIFLEFLRVAHEAVLLDMFSSFEEAMQLTQFATFKFGEEVEREQKANQREQDGAASSSGTGSEIDSGYDSDGPGGSGSSQYEKKELILRIPFIMIWKVESAGGAGAIDTTL